MSICAGGGGAGVSRTGRLAALTNFLEPCFSCTAPARGRLVTDFLADPAGRSGAAFLRDIEQPSHYNGFNLLLAQVLPPSRESADGGVALSYFGNRDPVAGPLTLGPGIYGLGNQHLDTPWLKIQRGKHLLSELIRTHADDMDPADVFDGVLQDRRRFPEHRPGVWDHTFEADLSSIFSWHRPRHYGTRSACVVLVDRANRVTVCERSYGLDADGDLSPAVVTGERRLSFDIEFGPGSEHGPATGAPRRLQEEAAIREGAPGRRAVVA